MYTIGEGGIRPEMVSLSSVYSEDRFRFGSAQVGLNSRSGWRPARNSMQESLTVSIYTMFMIVFFSIKKSFTAKTIKEHLFLLHQIINNNVNLFLFKYFRIKRQKITKYPF